MIIIKFIFKLIFLYIKIDIIKRIEDDVWIIKYFKIISILNVLDIKIIGIKKNKLISKARKQLIQQLVEII